LETTILPVLNGRRANPRSRFVAVQTDITARKRGEHELEDKLRLQKLLVRLSSGFAALPPSQIDAAVEDAQRHMVEALNLERSTLWQFVDEGGGMVLTHYWQPPDLPPLPKSTVSTSLFPWATRELTSGRSIILGRLESLPPGADVDQKSFRAHGTKSTITIPLVADGSVFGAISFGTLTRERAWKDDEIEDFHLIARIIGNVLALQRAEIRTGHLRAEIAHGARVATLGEIGSALAHELNQPLAAILCNAQAARRFITNQAMDPAELMEILDDIVRDNKHAGTVVRNSREMLSNRPSPPEICCLREVVGEVLQLLRREFLGGGIEVRPALSAGGLSVFATRVELQQVLMNILLNAGQAMKETPPENKRIDLRAGASRGIVKISVRDRGCGIPGGHPDKIFSPFYNTKEDGLGMGLAISRRIVQSHGGRIEAAYHPGGGAVLSVFLPSAPSKK